MSDIPPDPWEKVAQQGGGHAWIASFPVADGIDDLDLAVYEFAGSWVFDIEHRDEGELRSGERDSQAEAMAAALAAAPEVARAVASRLAGG